METSASEEGRLEEPLLSSSSTPTLQGTSSPMCARENDDSPEEIVSEEQQIQHSQPEFLEGAENHDDEKPWYECPLQLIAMLSNYSTSYNVVNIAMVIPIFEHTIAGTTKEDVAASASSLLAGMIVGQLLGGYLGDTKLGRLGALQLVMALQVVASIASALLWTHLSREKFFMWLAIFRFLLGVGAGGVYPLAAVLSAEQGSDDKQQRTSSQEVGEQSPKQVRRVVLTFSTQGLGFISVPLVSVLLLCITSNLNVVWRLILALGSVPGLILMGAQLWIHRKNSHQAVPLSDEDDVEDATGANQHTQPSGDQENENPDQNQSEQDNEGVLIRDIQLLEEELRENRGRWETIRREPNLVRKLLGTAGTWFLFDVLFYGNSLFQPVVIDAAFGGSHKGGDPISEIRDTAIKSLFVYSIALPGYAVAGMVMSKRVCCILQTPKYVMLQGFAAMGTLYLALGTNWTALKRTPVLLVLLYGLTFFFANYGPNTTTFILPSMVFSPQCRTTLNGVSAAAGKLGALLGATLFDPLVEDIGDANVMLICAGVAFLSFLMTWNFVQAHSPTHHHEV